MVPAAAARQHLIDGKYVTRLEILLSLEALVDRRKVAKELCASPRGTAMMRTVCWTDIDQLLGALDGRGIARLAARSELCR
jgi:hypothetical protein